MPSRVWLNHLINVVIRRQCSVGQAAWPSDLSTIERQYENGDVGIVLTDSELSVTQADHGREVTFNHFAHCLRAASDILGTSTDTAQDAMLLLGVSAYSAGLIAEAESVIALLDQHDEDIRVDRSNELGAVIGRALMDGVPPNANVLVNHPFLHLRRHGEFLLFRRLAKTVKAGLGRLGKVPDDSSVYAHLGWAQGRLHRAVSASIALAHVDGIVDGEERDLIDALIEAARFDETERIMLITEFDEPLRVQDIAVSKIESAEKQFLFRLLFLGVHINGRYHSNEKLFMEKLALELGVDARDLDAHEDVALITFEANYRLLERIAPSGLLGHIRERLMERVEETLKRNTKRIWAEIGETRELIELLAESTQRPLTAGEEDKIREQLTDVLRAIPALAVFAAPGGLVLLPFISKYLKINFAPSNFVDRAALGIQDSGGSQTSPSSVKQASVDSKDSGSYKPSNDGTR